MSSNKELIESIRKSFLALALQNGSKFHNKDFERIRSEDWPIERFVLVHKNESNSFNSLVSAMEWRNNFGINNLTDNSFPAEMHKIGEFIHTKDKQSRTVMWWRIARHLQVKISFPTLEQQYLAYNIEKVDRISKNQGWAAVIDTKGCGPGNVDHTMSVFLIKMLLSYYPRGPKYAAIIDLPFIVEAATNVILHAMNEELRNITKILKRDDVTQFMEMQSIPDTTESTNNLLNILTKVLPGHISIITGAVTGAVTDIINTK